jgi:lysophospholipase L1-like esterase
MRSFLLVLAGCGQPVLPVLVVESEPAPATVSTGEAPEAPGTTGADTAVPAADPPANLPDGVLVVGFGDSVTKGYCSSAGHDYVSLLVENDETLHPTWAGRDLSSHFETVELHNGAINGTTSCSYTEEDIRAEIRAELSGLPSEPELTLVLITLGGNDLIEPYGCSGPMECAAYCSTVEQATPWSEAYRDRMIAFVEAFQTEIGGDVRVFLGTIYDPTDGVGDVEQAPMVDLPPWPEGLEVHGMYNHRIAEVAEATGSVVVDMHAAMLGHGIHHADPGHPYYDAADPTHWYCSNFEDPNDLGYHAIREAFWNSLERSLSLP